MTGQIVKVLVPPPVAIPRGAEWAASLVCGLARLGRSLWRELEKVGQARAERELQRLARQPEFARMLRDAMHPAAKGRE